VLIARYIGITTQELETMPTYKIDQYRVIRAAEMKAQQVTNGRRSTGR
jgi:hypothetical protein